MADVIEDAWRSGARFDSWNDQLQWDAWVQAMERLDTVPYDLYLGTLPTDARLPWDHLDMQLEPRFLATEYRRAMRNKLSPPCGKPVGAQVHHNNLAEHEQDERILVCYHCGVECDMTRMREERGEFLAKLKAYEPPPVESEEAIGQTAATKPNGNGNKPHDFGQGEPRRFRVRFAKRGVMALTGHLDLVRTLPRIMRRAGIQAYYTEGFHPKPLPEFAPPLPLGVETLDEYVDLSLREDMRVEELLQSLNAHAPLGFEFLEARRLEPGAPKLARVLAAAEYVVRVEAEHLVGLDEETLDRAPERFLARAEVRLAVFRKRKQKTVDIRPAVQTVRWIDAADLPPELDFARPGARYLLVRTLLGAEVHARPEEVASCVLGRDPGFESIHIARTRLILNPEATVARGKPSETKELPAYEPGSCRRSSPTRGPALQH